MRRIFLIITFLITTFSAKIFAVEYMGIELSSSLLPGQKYNSKNNRVKTNSGELDTRLLIPLEFGNHCYINTFNYNYRRYAYKNDRKSSEYFYRPKCLHALQYSGLFYFDFEPFLSILSGDLKSAYEAEKPIDRDTLTLSSNIIFGRTFYTFPLGVGAGFSSSSIGCSYYPVLYFSYAQNKLHIELMLPEDAEFTYELIDNFSIGLYHHITSDIYSLKNSNKRTDNPYVAFSEYIAGVLTRYSLEKWLYIELKAGVLYYGTRSYYNDDAKILSVRQAPSFKVECQISAGY
jgi:hypothetical protein